MNQQRREQAQIAVRYENFNAWYAEQRQGADYLSSLTEFKELTRFASAQGIVAQTAPQLPTVALCLATPAAAPAFMHPGCAGWLLGPDRLGVVLREGHLALNGPDGTLTSVPLAQAPAAATCVLCSLPLAGPSGLQKGGAG